MAQVTASASGASPAGDSASAAAALAATPTAPPATDASVRAVSLLPSITELVAAVAPQGVLVGVTHCCDFPPEAVHAARVVTSSEVDPRKLSQAEIHRRVQGALAVGHSIYRIDEEALRTLRPTVVFTQALCDVCAVNMPLVLDTCGRLMGDEEGLRVVSLEPGTLEEVCLCASYPPRLKQCLDQAPLSVGS